MSENRKVAILGAGRLGESMLRGLLSTGWREPQEVVVTSRRAERRDALAALYGVEATADNAAAIRGARLVVLSVKPQDIAGLLGEIAAVVSPGQTLLSVAAGVTTPAIESRLPEGARVVRAMPNAPALVHEGIAGLCGGEHARDEDLEMATSALGHLGAVVRVAEDDMDAVTALSGSGPAYFALLAEAMIEAGLLLGLSRDVSTRLVVQTMFGSARLLRDEQMHPVELREAVTSPGGTTTRAIRELERPGVRAAFLHAINAATERSRELAERLPRAE
jgi:pyrroline-5-carboxylate reductase